MSLATTYSPQSQRSIDRVYDAVIERGLKVKRLHPDDYLVQCPVHDDRSPSLHITYDADKGMTLLWCQAGSCDAPWDEYLYALGLDRKAAFDRPLERREWPVKPFVTKGQRRPKRAPLPPRVLDESAAEGLPESAFQETQRYTYARSNGEVVQEVIRLEASDGARREKRFSQRFINPKTDRWVGSKPTGFKPALYNEAAVTSAIEAGAPVWLVEGEKDADNGEAAGLITTTNAQGAGSFPTELAALLGGADVRVVVDRDAAGAKRALQLLDLLPVQKQPASVRVFVPATRDDKSDLSDHLGAGFGVDDLIEISRPDADALWRRYEADTLATRIRRDGAEAAARRERGEVDLAQRWAQETETHRTKIAALVDEAPTAAEVGEEGAATLELLQDVLRRAWHLRDLAHEVAGLAPTAAPVESESTSVKTPTAPKLEAIIIGGDGGGDYFDGTGSGGEGKAPNTAPVYEVRDGETVRVTWRDGEPSYRTVMRGWATVLEEVTLDDGDPSEFARPRDFYRIRFERWKRDPETGRPLRYESGNHVIERKVKQFDLESIRTRTWTQALPFQGMLIQSTPKGIAEAWDAIFNALPPAPDAARVNYSTPGWRTLQQSDGTETEVFVHRSGGISADGTVQVDSRFEPEGPFAMFDLPEPTTDQIVLRKAWIESTIPLAQNLPARMVAPLLGLVWHAPFAKPRMFTHCQGAAGAGKTALAMTVSQYLAPLVHHNAKRKVMVSGSDSGSTTTGLRGAMSQYGHVPVIVDDFAPDLAPEKVRKKLNDIIRQFFDSAPRTLGTRTGGTRQERPMVLTPIGTGELGPSGSAVSRTLVIPVNPNDVRDPGATFGPLETKAMRQHKATLGAALVQWIAQNREQLTDEAESDSDQTIECRARWTALLADMPHADGMRDRFVDDAVVRHRGIRFMLRMLLEHHAINDDEAGRFEEWAIAGMREAYMSQHAEDADPARMFLQFLRESLANGRAFISDVHDAAPDEFQRALGWRQIGTNFKDQSPEWAPPQRGIRVGYIVKDRVWLITGTSFEVARQAATQSGETLSETVQSVGSSLVAHGWMNHDHEGKASTRHRIDRSQIRVWDIPLDALLATDEDGHGSRHDGGGEPEPTPPIQPTLDLTPDPIAPAPVTPAADPAPAAPTSAPSATPGAETAAAPPDTSVPAAAPQDASVPAVAPVVDAEHGTITLRARGGAAHAAPTSAQAKPDRDATFRAAVAVLDTEGLWLPDGTLVELPDGIGHFGSLADYAMQLNLGSWCGWKYTLPTIVISPDALQRLGVQLDVIPKVWEDRKKLLQQLGEHPMLATARQYGWSTGKGEVQLRGLNRITAGESQHFGAQIMLLDLMSDEIDRLLHDDPDAVTVARRLQRLADLGIPFSSDASATGRNVMEAVTAVRDPEVRRAFMQPSKVINPSSIQALEDDLNWCRKPTDAEQQHRYVHAYDRGGSYLAVVSGVYFGLGAPIHFPEGIEYRGEKQQAYYRVQLPDAESLPWNMPSPFGAYSDQHVLGRDGWITAPTYWIAQRLGYELPILEAYVWEDSRKFLEPWANTISTARTTLDTDNGDDQAARDLVKEIYVRTIGKMASTLGNNPHRPGFAPERRHAIQAKARANMLYRIEQIGQASGRYPVAVLKDTILYTSDVADPLEAWPGEAKLLGRGLGQYKPEGSAPMSEHLPFLTGGKYEGKAGLE